MDKNNVYSIDIERINKIKSGKQVEVYEQLADSNRQSLDPNISEIVTDAKQAVEIYRASKNVSIISKPILIYYSFIMLARIMFLCTYKKNYSKLLRTDTHGLDFVGVTDVKCKMVGAFPRFHDSISSNPEIYTDEHQFAWKDLICFPTNRFQIEYDFAEYQFKRQVEHDTGNLKIDELTREILFLYSMSMLARYSPHYWSELLNKKEEGWKIVEYLRTIQSYFPNLILNHLLGEQHDFYPESRLVGDKEHYTDKF